MLGGILESNINKAKQSRIIKILRRWRGPGGRGPVGEARRAPATARLKANAGLKKQKSRWMEYHGMIEEGSAGARGPPAKARAERNWC